MKKVKSKKYTNDDFDRDFSVIAKKYEADNKGKICWIQLSEFVIISKKHGPDKITESDWKSIWKK